ncbi:hypothetical protein PsorP6_011270 [Peronosclerospora sorghi]|uniref:Uncharacterized protein n=1 Tax=Peronosclerospora sorghi TaxID=230839 RepID=A0ACC0WMB9_9STRA|nr:hypothetical protein PsorP6_011270 [Peronosclerospora sorghi]
MTMVVRVPLVNHLQQGISCNGYGYPVSETPATGKNIIHSFIEVARDLLVMSNTIPQFPLYLASNQREPSTSHSLKMLNLYPPATHSAWNGQALSYPPGTDSIVNEIYEATKGIGTKEKQLNKALGGKTPTQRAFIAKRYKELHNKSLRELVDEETSGHYGFLLKLLASPLPEAEAGILHKATKGLGTKEDLIYPVVVGRTNVEINILKKTYYEVYGEDLGSVLDNDLHGDFQKIILASLQAALVPYDPTIHNAAKVEADVEKLYKTGRGRMGTDEEGFVGVLVSCPPEHLRVVAAAYEKKYGESLVKAAAHEFSGHAEKAVLFLIRMITEPLEMLAELFESAMKGFGTDENALSSAVVRYHIVLRDIKPVYKKKYGKELRERIAEEVSGDYERSSLDKEHAMVGLKESQIRKDVLQRWDFYSSRFSLVHTHLPPPAGTVSRHGSSFCMYLSSYYYCRLDCRMRGPFVNE